MDSCPGPAGGGGLSRRVDPWPAGELVRVVPPRQIGGRVYTESSWLEAYEPACRRDVGRVIRVGGPIIREREAVRAVRAILPSIRTRRDLHRATAWQPFKWVGRGPYVRYFKESLLTWANARAKAAA